MGDVEGVVGVDIAVGVGAEVVEDVVFERVRVLHDVGVEVEPPETLRLRILPHTVPDDDDLLPALAPLVGIPPLRHHVGDLQVISPSFRVFLLVRNTVPLNRPLTGSLPLHDSPLDIRRQCYHYLPSRSKGRPPAGLNEGGPKHQVADKTKNSNKQQSYLRPAQYRTQKRDQIPSPAPTTSRSTPSPTAQLLLLPVVLRRGGGDLELGQTGGDPALLAREEAIIPRREGRIASDLFALGPGRGPGGDATRSDGGGDGATGVDAARTGAGAGGGQTGAGPASPGVWRRRSRQRHGRAIGRRGGSWDGGQRSAGEGTRGQARRSALDLTRRRRLLQAEGWEIDRGAPSPVRARRGIGSR